MTDMDLAREMAAAVLAGDEASAYALADILSECRARGETLATYCEGKHSFAAEYVRLVRGLMGVKEKWQSLDDWYEFRRMRRDLPRQDAAELCALRVLLSREKEDVRGESWLWVCWRAWEPSLSVYAAGILGNLSFVTPAEVAAKGKHWWKSVPGVGAATFASLEKMLARHGVNWRHEG